MKKHKITYEDMLKTEYRNALSQYKNAWGMFNNASDEYVEASILSLKAAELSLNAVYQKIKIYHASNPDFVNDVIPVEMVYPIEF